MKEEKARFDAQPIPQGLPPVSEYVLIMRELRINHHIVNKEVYSRGISMIYQRPDYPVSEDKLFMSGQDAVKLGLAEGDIVEIESKTGSLSKPVYIKDGLRQGVLEYIVFKDRSQVFKLSTTPTKWIEVKVRKG
jgi:anaerobic selenocysteine-containing dehydrogenase